MVNNATKKVVGLIPLVFVLGITATALKRLEAKEKRELKKKQKKRRRLSKVS